jgi:hypothetical protein
MAFQQTDNGLLGLTTQRWVVSGSLTNGGSVTSNEIQLQLQITDKDTGAILYTTTGTTTPGTLGAGETGTYAFYFTSDDLGGAKNTDMHADVKVLSY